MQALEQPPRDALYPPNLAPPYPVFQFNGHDIPIDPQLGGPAFEPPPSEEQGKVEESQSDTLSIPEHLQQPVEYVEPLRQFSEGPQGDPFAPPPPPYMPIAIEQSPPPKPMPKKKRKTHHCGSCDGTDAKNKYKRPEPMVTCVECSRRDHPSCISDGLTGDVVRSYDWRCSDCKICEVCLSKGDEAKMVFCDHCDRGWHQDCLQPPLEETPKGKWHCPKCPALEPDMPPAGDDDTDSDTPIIQVEASVRASSLASSSYQRGATGPKITLFSESSDSDSDDDEEVVGTPIRSIKAPPKPAAKRSHKKRGRPPKEPVVGSDGEATPRRSRGKRQRAQSPVAAPPLPRVRLRLPNVQKGKGKEKEPPESPKGLFDDILGVTERDTSKTSIIAWDKQQFDRSRQSAEDKLAPQPSHADVSSTPVAGPSRPLRSATSLHHISIPSPATYLASPSPSTPGAKVPAFPSLHQPDALRIRTIRFGQFDIKTWYDAPFPEEYASIPDGRLWICEFCLKYMKSRLTAGRHKLKCKARHPPGDEIYRDGVISIFEVDGRKNKIYCQNLCLLSKMFLDHKSLFYDVEPFLFYVITETDEYGARFVGYFSKEKRCLKDYNLSCIMTLPVRQRQGWGNLLIDFSYLLSKKERRAGSPEKPLSALGAIGYRKYWTYALMRFLETAPDSLTLEDISRGTAMTLEDVHNTLVQQNMITVRDTTPLARPSPGQSIKYPKGRRSGVARRALQRTQTQDDDEANKAPFVPPDSYHIHWDPDKVSSYLSIWRGKGYLQLKPEKLKWTPFLISRAEKQMPQSEVFGETPREDASSGQARSPSSIGQRAAGLEDQLPAPSSTSPSSGNGPNGRSVSIDTTHLQSSPSPSPIPTSARRRTRSQNVASPAPRRSVSTVAAPRLRPTRSTSRMLLSPTADDEALAAQLQAEEQTSTRQLRTRTNSSHRVQQVSATPVRASLKRKRIESPPEGDDYDEYQEPIQPPAPSPPPAQLNGHHDPPGISVACKTPTPPLNDNSDVFVPVQRDGHQAVTCTPSELDIATLLVSMNHSMPSPVVPPLHTNYTNTNGIKSEDTSPSSSVPNEQLLPPHHTINIYHYPNGSQVNDSSEMSSKLLTSNPDHITLKQTPRDPSFLGFSMAIDDYGYAKSEEPSERAASHHVSEDNSVHISLPHVVDMESVDMYGDEDADGEYEEEDAEGEPDEEFNMDPQDTM